MPASDLQQQLEGLRRTPAGRAPAIRRLRLALAGALSLAATAAMLPHPARAADKPAGVAIQPATQPAGTP